VSVVATSEGIVTLEEALGLQRKQSVALYREHVNPDLCSQFSIVGLDRRFVRALGVSVFDDHGNEYLDFLGGYGALSFGHNHPEIVAAVRAVEELPNLFQISVGALVGPLGSSLAAIEPGLLNKSFFCNSGAEAVEGALKLARISSGRTHLVYADNSFHGKSMGALSVTGRSKYQVPFRPLVPDCHVVPFGDLDALEEALRTWECAAFIVEPVQGEAGVIVPPDGYMKAAEELCHAHGALLIADEIQTGFGRTGATFAVDFDDAKPDIMATAKALGGGVMPSAPIRPRMRSGKPATAPSRSAFFTRRPLGGTPGRWRQGSRPSRSSSATGSPTPLAPRVSDSRPVSSALPRRPASSRRSGGVGSSSASSSTSPR
jgi:putrescine aminotransferase